ncbi:PREDICTED: FIP1[III]-like protein isoform X2 [Lupinus angustifolius]|uniref:FIP1[III]-like protein isoform X2 n=1 Tax=Lupinus angustifolius TaxID=3871 RepID=UPI00092FCAB0|nr:PREDICTED: FIP1[III]-like protein isoform X2 [Lupinus angustifolius]
MEAAFEDDDFGELYANIEVSNIHPEPKPEPKPEPEAKSNCPNLNQKDLVDDSVSHAKDDSSASGSDDDLKTVLNDDDCKGSAAAATAVGDEDDHHLIDGDELVNNNEVECGYGSRVFHHKYMRSRGGSMFANNMKAYKSMEMASYRSSLNRGRCNGDVCFQHLASSTCHVNPMYSAGNPMVAQYGYGSFLPWNNFDVNIDTLDAKPWRVPGAKEQFCRMPVQSDIPVNESAKLNQETIREQIDPVVSRSVSSPPSDHELPKGRAILVENSTVERRPSMNVKRPRSRDSDVIIQIKVLESSDDCSRNSVVMNPSLEGESAVGNKKKIPNSSSEHDVLSEDQLEDVKNSVDSSVQERNGLILGVDEAKCQDQADQHSEDTSQVPGGEIKVEKGIGVGTYSADPCWIESELSLGDQELSLSSYSDSDSEAPGNSVHDDCEKGHIPLRRQSVNSVIDLKESLPLYSKNSKNDRFKTKPEIVPYYSRNRGPIRKEWRCQSGRINPGSNLNRHSENDNDVSVIRMSRAREMSLLDHQFVDYGRYKERLQDFGSRKGRDVSYNRETKQSCYYDGERFLDDLVQTVRTKYSYREDQESSRENTNQHNRRNVDERNYFCEPIFPTEHSEDRDRDWYHADWGYSADEPSPQSYRETRQFFPRHSSFPARGGNTQRRRTNNRSHFRDRKYNDDFDECEFEFLNKSYRMPTSSAEREMDYLDNKHEEQFPHIDRDWERSARRGRHHDCPPLVSNNFWSGKIEDKCSKYKHHQTSHYRYCRESSTDSRRNYVHDTRHKDATKNSGNYWPCGYTDAAEDEDFIISPAEEYQFYKSPSEVLNWTEDETIHRHHETHAASLHTAVQIDYRKMQHHQLNMLRRGSENSLKGSSKILYRGERGQTVQRCRKSVDFVNGEVKSHTRSSGVLCNGRLENADQVISAKKRKAIMSLDESHKVIKFDTSKSENNHENKKRLQNLPDTRQEDSDIEEGQIVTEEPYKKASVSERDVSEGATPAVSVKKRMSQNDNKSEQLIGAYDKQRILDSLAKMEKRRERFKQPATMKKEAEESLKLSNDSIVNADEMKQQRPARKRRWVGT